MASLPYPTALANVSPLALLAGAAASFLLYKAISFAKAYADLTLLSKKQIPPDAFHNKIIWIVGASQGLGETIAHTFAASGARLILSSRSPEKLQTVKTTILASHPTAQIEILPLDLTASGQDMDVAAADAFALFNAQGVDYVIHNAGASQHAAVESTAHHVADSLLSLNLQGPIHLARATLPHMLRRRAGRHVVIASMSSIVPSPGQAVYAAAKSGLRAYFNSLTSELAASGVGATVVCPGPLASTACQRMVYGSTGLMQQAVQTGMSKKRVGVEQCAALVAAAAYHNLDECWIAFHPVLLMGYLMQYVPTLGMAVLKRIGPGRVSQLRDGSGSGYDVRAMLSGAAKVD